MKYSEYKRVVIKIGSNILTDDTNKLDLNNLRQLVEQICHVHSKGIEIIVVSSGAIVCGSERLGISRKSIPEKQAAAAVGQSILMNEYNRFFEPKGIIIAQLLLTRLGLEFGESYTNAQNTLSTLLENKVIPIINENDSIAVDEIKFGDNDLLSVYVAELIKANALIILTDIDGLYSKDPRFYEDACLMTEVCEVTPEILSSCGGSGTDKGTGGMYSKVCAAQKGVSLGIDVTVANGRKKDVILDIFSGKRAGTLFSCKVV